MTIRRTCSNCKGVAVCRTCATSGGCWHELCATCGAMDMPRVQAWLLAQVLREQLTGRAVWPADAAAVTS